MQALKTGHLHQPVDQLRAWPFYIQLRLCDFPLKLRVRFRDDQRY